VDIRYESQGLHATKAFISMLDGKRFEYVDPDDRREALRKCLEHIAELMEARNS